MSVKCRYGSCIQGTVNCTCSTSEFRPRPIDIEPFQPRTRYQSVAESLLPRGTGPSFRDDVIDGLTGDQATSMLTWLARHAPEVFDAARFAAL